MKYRRGQITADKEVRCRTVMAAMPQAPRKYANETVWYTFYNEAEKRQYHYEPKTKTAKWVKKTNSTSATDIHGKTRVVVTPERFYTKRIDHHRVKTKVEDSPERLFVQGKHKPVIDEMDEDLEFRAGMSRDDNSRKWHTRIMLCHGAVVQTLVSTRVATVMLVLNVLLTFLIISARLCSDDERFRVAVDLSRDLCTPSAT